MIREPILIVDDDLEVRSSLREALSDLGYTVEMADGAQTALRRLHERRFAILLTDLNLPGGPTGLELIESAKALDPRMLCIVITGFATLESAITALRSRAYDFIRKPFKLAEVEVALDRALEHIRLRAELEEAQSELEARLSARTRGLHQLESDAERLCAAVQAARDAEDPAAALAPFRTFLAAHWQPDGVGLYLEDAGGIFRRAFQAGQRPFPETVVGSLEAAVPYPEAFAFPLAPRAWLGLGYLERSSLEPDEPAFRLFLQHLSLAVPDFRRLAAIPFPRG